MVAPQTHDDFAAWQRWVALLWLALWIPTYWRTWGISNFVQLCDLAVLLTCIGIWSDSPVLISSQAVSSILVDLAWALDAAWRILFGHHLIGGTEYMFNGQYPLWVRLLSFVPSGDARFAIVGGAPHGLRAEGIRTAMPDRIGCVRSGAVHESGEKYEFCFR